MYLFVRILFFLPGCRPGSKLFCRCSFSFRLTRRAFDPGDDPLQAQPRTRYVKGRFATAEGDLFIGEKRVCQGVMNDDLLLRELSKRELKCWRALHR